MEHELKKIPRIAAVRESSKKQHTEGVAMLTIARTGLPYAVMSCGSPMTERSVSCILYAD
jgi:hypothetical protein